MRKIQEFASVEVEVIAGRSYVERDGLDATAARIEIHTPKIVEESGIGALCVTSNL